MILYRFTTPVYKLFTGALRLITEQFPAILAAILGLHCLNFEDIRDKPQNASWPEKS